MRCVRGVEFHTGSREERIPGFCEEFPYIASRAELDRYFGRFVPWHWHKAVELFYMESGALEYDTPGGRRLFGKGSGGLVNSNVLHMTRPVAGGEENIQLLHMFDPSLIAGQQGGRIDRNYVMPLVAAPQIEILALDPKDPEQAETLRLIRRAFEIPGDAFGSEMQVRRALSEIWLRLFQQARPLLAAEKKPDKNSDKVKALMIYVHEHYPERFSISELAAAAFLSERECFRVFHDCLHTSPMEYVKHYRLRAACRMLAQGKEPITEICHACGLGSSSYFGKIFRECMNCTPSEYRRRWQDRDKSWQGPHSPSWDAAL